MKGHHLRKEKNCLNCGAIVQERYCSHCGQENKPTKESFGHLTGHFLADITHFDSKLFTTLKDLIFKPGFLTREYNAGKRVRYLSPIRMYVFISAVFFLVMFSQKPEEDEAGRIENSQNDSNVFRQHLADSLRQIVNTPDRKNLKDTFSDNIYRRLAERLDTLPTERDTSESVAAFVNNSGVITFHLQENKYADTHEYDSIQRTLPSKARDDLITRYIVRKSIWLTHGKHHTNGLVISRNFKHDIPKIMFLLLPVFALFIGLFYGRGKFFYSQHVIFSLHFHSFIFIFLMLEGLIERILPMDKMWLIMIGLTLFCIFIYLTTGLRNTYRQALWLSGVKALAISILYIASLVVCIIIVMAASFILLR